MLLQKRKFDTQDIFNTSEDGANVATFNWCCTWMMSSVPIWPLLCCIQSGLKSRKKINFDLLDKHLWGKYASYTPLRSENVHNL